MPPCLLLTTTQASFEDGRHRLVQAWFEDGRQLMMDCVRKTHTLSEAAIEEANTRIRDLALMSDQQGVSYEDAEMHLVYFDTKFEKRGSLLYLVFEQMLSDGSSQAGWQQVGGKRVPDFHPCAKFQGDRPGACFKTGPKGPGYYAEGAAHGAAANLLLLQRRLVCHTAGSQLKVASIGGGPGTDASGLVWANSHFLNYQGFADVQCTLFDKETSWGQYVPALQELMPTIPLSFVTCDVTMGLGDECNTQLNEAAQETQLWVFRYVCHESSVLAAAGHWGFYRSLAQQAQPGSVFLFLDVIKHSAECLDEIWEAMNQGLATGGGGGAPAASAAGFTRLDLPSDGKLIKSTVMVLFRTDQLALEAVSAAEQACHEALACTYAYA